eukprot:scaffold160975_cov24-Tisochrysis_lutea.AAC.3
MEGAKLGEMAQGGWVNEGGRRRGREGGVAGALCAVMPCHALSSPASHPPSLSLALSSSAVPSATPLSTLPHLLLPRYAFFSPTVSPTSLSLPCDPFPGSCSPF